MAIIDEDLENRVRELASEVEGEKLVTRRVYDQAIRNGDQIGALRSEVATARVDIQALTSQADHIVGEVVQCTAALRSQGARLDTLTRDIGLLRNDVTALRRGQEELYARLDRHEEELHARLDRHEERIDALRAEQEAMRAEQEASRTELAEMNRKLDVLIAAIGGGGHRDDH
jgi:chromosome segregation ATPase